VDGAAVKRVYEITVEGGTRLIDATGKDITARGLPTHRFEFFADGPELAQDHADSLHADPNFGNVLGKPRFVGWSEEGSL